MSERIGVEITARDGASRVFSQVTSGLDRMERSLDNADRASGRFSRSGAAMGAALAGVTGILSNAARAAAEAEVSQTRLQSSVEATGALYEEFAQQLTAAGEAAVQMAFDDEEAADALSYLTQATGDAQTALNDLGLVMDIARGRGIGLAEAAKIVAAAEQERFGALARIGIKLDENATKEEAIAALQARYSGQAAAYAETQAGNYDRWLVKLGNVNEALGEHTGQLQEVLMVLPGLSAGYTAIAAALGGLAPLLKTSGAGLVGMLGPLSGVAIGAAAVGVMLANPEGTGPSAQPAYWEEAQKQAVLMEGTLQRLASSGKTDAASIAESASAISADVLTQVTRLNELIYKIENTENATAGQTAAWWHEVGVINDQLGFDFANSERPLQMLDSLNTVLGYTGEGAGLAQEQLGLLIEQYESGELTAGQFAGQVNVLSQSLSGFDAMAEAGVTSTLDLTEATENYTDAQGRAFDETMKRVKAQVAAAEIDKQIAKAQEALATQMDATRRAYTGVFEAQAAGFRVAVQNTDAIGQQSQAVADWAENLIGAQGAYSKLDDLVNAGRISGKSGEFDAPTQYAAAQRAYNSILKDNAQIQEHIATIQAKQAPLQAQLLAQQEERLRQLSNASAEEQMLGLAYMDQATSMQALSLAQGLIENRDVFGPMIEQMAEADPYLRAILEDLGLIEVDRNGNVSISGTGEAKSDLELLTSALDTLVMTQWIAMFGGDISQAEQAYEDATGLLVDWDNSEGTATVSVDDQATGTLQNISALLWGLQDRTVTVTTINQAINPFALGGVAGYAAGGVVIRAGEAGMEQFDFPNGRHGLAVTDGLYTVPMGTYVHTAPATATKGGGPSINVTIAGNVYGIDDLERQLTRSIAGAWTSAMRMHERSYGAY